MDTVFSPVSGGGNYRVSIPRLPDGDGVQLLDVALGVTSGGLTPCTSASGAFKTADIGKAVAFFTGSTGATRGNGTIYSVESSGACTLALASAVGSPLSNVIMVYGTDKGAQANAILLANRAYGGCEVGSGIMCSSVPIVVPDGVELYGRGRIGGYDLPENFVLNRAAIVLVAPTAAAALSGVITLGDGLGGGSPRAYGVNVDSMMMADFAIYMSTGGARVEDSLALRARTNGGNGAAVRMSSGSTLKSCVAVSQNTSHCILADSVSDVHIIQGAAFGAGASRHGIKFANAVDAEAVGVHAWKSSNQSLAGSAVRIEAYGGSKSKNNSIQGCTLDTSHGPHIDLEAFASSIVQGLSIAANKGFQNDAVTAATYPYMRFSGNATGYYRGVSVVGNVGDSSFADESKGTYTAFAEGVGTLNLRAVAVTGNAVNNCAAGYTSFTPNVSANNAIVPYGSGTTTTF